jgi:hypothetical protein
MRKQDRQQQFRLNPRQFRDLIHLKAEPRSTEANSGTPRYPKFRPQRGQPLIRPRSTRPLLTHWKIKNALSTRNPQGLTFDINWLEAFGVSFAIEISAAFSARSAVRKLFYLGRPSATRCKGAAKSIRFPARHAQASTTIT